MTADPQLIRSGRHDLVGEIIGRDAGLIIQRWAARALEEQPHARRTHHEALLDHLPLFLWELGRSLAEPDPSGAAPHQGPARQHGEHRWEAGWSIEEVVRDYQILRLVILDHLEQALGRPPKHREVLAVGLALDEAISASVRQYAAHQEQQAVRAERERAEQDHTALREAGERKDEFLAVLGHELRNPLGSARNAVQLLRLRGDDPALRDWAADVLERQLRQMHRLVDDLLDVSRVGRGNLSLQVEVLDLVPVVRGVADDFRASLEAAGLALRVRVPEAPVRVRGDAARLAQVVGNLVGNAAKFTDHGGTLALELDCDGDDWACITVRDTGIGIEPALLDWVFDTFMQADGGRSRSRGGLGLGLALVRGLVELHGGQVKAFSDGPGHGSTFTVRLRCEPPAVPAGG